MIDQSTSQISAISAAELLERVGTPDGPMVFDLRRAEAYAASPGVIPGARWRDHKLVEQWAGEVPPGRETVVYCVHGHQVSRSALIELEAAGVTVRLLEGGIEAYAEAGGRLMHREAIEVSTGELPAVWLLPRPVDLGSAACAWFVRRFIDTGARMRFAEDEWADAIAQELEAHCVGFPGRPVATIDALCDVVALDDPAVRRIAALVGESPSGEPFAAPETAGIDAIYAGLARITISPDDLVRRSAGLFDGLYAWFRTSPTATSHDD